MDKTPTVLAAFAHIGKHYTEEAITKAGFFCDANSIYYNLKNGGSKHRDFNQKAWRFAGGGKSELLLVPGSKTFPLVITEGETDLLALLSKGYQGPIATGTCGAGTFNMKWVQEIKDQISLGAITNVPVAIIYDTDDPGQTGAKAVANKFLAAGIRCKNIKLNVAVGKKDLSDWLEDHTLEEFIWFINMHQEIRITYKKMPIKPTERTTIASRSQNSKHLGLAEALGKLQNVKMMMNGKYTAQCPAHEDRHNSLTISKGDRVEIVLYCFAGCSYEDIVKQLSFF